jgi:hypothetical protein
VATIGDLIRIYSASPHRQTDSEIVLSAAQQESRAGQRTFDVGFVTRELALRHVVGSLSGMGKSLSRELAGLVDPPRATTTRAAPITRRTTLHGDDLMVITGRTYPRDIAFRLHSRTLP